MRRRFQVRRYNGVNQASCRVTKIHAGCCGARDMERNFDGFANYGIDGFFLPHAIQILVERFNIFVGELRQKFGFIACVLDQVTHQLPIAGEILAPACDQQNLDQQPEPECRADRSGAYSRRHGFKTGQPIAKSCKRGRPNRIWHLRLRETDNASSRRVKIDIVITGPGGKTGIVVIVPSSG